MKMHTTLLAIVTSAALISGAQAAVYVVNETLTPGNTIPDTSATAGVGAIGSFTGTYDATTGILEYTMTWENLSSPITGSPGAHIHGPAPLGSNARVLHFIVSDGAESGSAMGSFDFASNPAATEADFLANQFYVNIHTTTNGSGELRSQLNPELIPEPSALALAGLGLLGGVARRRRSRA